jgi:hypothetical protein
MVVATFDTLKFANSLKAAGVPDKQAEAEAAAISEARVSFYSAMPLPEFPPYEYDSTLAAL